MAAWYFAPVKEKSEWQRYGERLRDCIYSTALCIVSTCGDVTLELIKLGVSAPDTYTFRSQLWDAGGVGFCEPNE